jgi:predicted ribosomally synthesized peptide with SipW-like signal peptide
MKKTLVSLSIIGVVAAMAIGATVALFNDTETSSGNIFVAGELDLKVDHNYAMYNGNPCEERCVVDTSVNYVQNGSFENPEVTHSTKWDIFPSGYSGLIWTVEWRSDVPSTYKGWTRPNPALQELHEGVLGSAYDGDQYTELDSDWNGHNGNLNNEPASTKIYQDIATVPGQKYQLRFAFSPRPNTVNTQNKLEVKWNGVIVDVIGPIAGGGSINWTVYTYDVIASGPITRLEFTDLGNADSMGTFLDDVRLYKYNCQYQIIGGTCTLWDLKDLGPGDYYWNFGDVKPGDYGTNIISLHAYNNDAYACLINHNIQDLENNVVDPEIAAGDDAASTTGELSGFLKAFVWVDDSPQNNAYNSGETILYGPNAPFTDINTMIPVSLTASHTKYIGIAWCFGTQTVDASGIHCSGVGNQDISQTDIFKSYFTVYAEQQRNNDGFKCSDLQINKSSPKLY